MIQSNMVSIFCKHTEDSVTVDYPHNVDIFCGKRNVCKAEEHNSNDIELYLKIFY